MGIPSVASIEPLVKWLALCWYRQRRLSAAQLWWLWLITILIHLFLLVSGVLLSPPIAPAEGPGHGSAWRLPPLSWQVGLVILLLVLQPGEAPPFPWLCFRVRRVVRRRRLADMTLEQLLALLPPGVRTIAQLVDWLTRSQMVKLLAAIPILYPILAELDVEAIIDRYCPSEAEVNIGAVIVILCLNRLTAPQPLLGIADWAAKTIIQELTGVPASKLNDDRLARALDAIHPHLEAIWTEIVSRALVRYQIDLSLVFPGLSARTGYDLTTFHFEGQYKASTAITLGFSRSHKGKKQRKLALNVTAREKFPFLYQLLATRGNAADVSTVQANMQRLLQVLQERGWPVKAVLVVGDRAMLPVLAAPAGQGAPRSCWPITAPTSSTWGRSRSWARRKRP